jgi:hypothetical protein
MTTPKKCSRKKRGVSMIIGRERFAKISAVEGILPSEDMRARMAEFDRLGLSAEGRRRAIIKAHKKI